MTAAVLTVALAGALFALSNTTRAWMRARRDRDYARRGWGEAMSQANRLQVERDELAVQVAALRGRLSDRGVDPDVPSRVDALLSGVDVTSVLNRLEARTWSWRERLAWDRLDRNGGGL